MTVLVTGATGTVGATLLPLLLDAGTPVRALVPSPEDADDLRGYDVQVAIGDFDRPETLDDALRGVAAAFLLAPAGQDQAARELAFVDAVGRSPEQPHVVKLASLGWEDPRSRLSKGHAEVVRRLESDGVRHTVLAPNGFFQDLLRLSAMLQEESALLLPAGTAGVSHVDARDVAAVAAHVLSKPEPHEGANYAITGPAAVTYAQIAEQLTALLGHEIRYVDTPADEVRSRMLGYGWSEWTADGTIEVYATYSDGAAADVTDEVQKATGREARDLSTFLHDHQAAFRTV